MDPIWQFEINIIQTLQSWFSSQAAIFSGITALGSVQFFILIMPALYWCIDPGIGFKTALILILSGEFNSFFKLVFHSPRPFWYSSKITALSSETSFGMPSGHAMNTISIWGLIAAQFKKKALAWVCAAIILLVGFSRLVLGMHFMSDVVMGWILGGVLLLLFLNFEPMVTKKIKEMTLAQQLGLAIATSLGLIGFCFIPLVFLQNWQLPAQWVENARLSPLSALPNPLDQSGVFTSAGIWLGFCSGAAWMRSQGGFSAAGTGGQLFLRYLIGVAGIAILGIGFSKLLPHSTDVLGMGFEYFQYAIVGLWISGGAPAVFLKLKLANRNEKQEK